MSGEELALEPLISSGSRAVLCLACDRCGDGMGSSSKKLCSNGGSGGGGGGEIDKSLPEDKGEISTRCVKRRTGH